MSALPICLMVDDPEPVINPLYYVEQQVRHSPAPCQHSGEPMARCIPVSMAADFATLIGRYGVRGKFSVIPIPAGLGTIIDGWDGADKGEIDRWLDIARRQIESQMDITPEMLTHTNAIDLATMKMMDVSEKEWSHVQNEAALTPYITLALELLRKAGFDANGVTSPWDFAKQVEGDYARAILAAQRKVYNRSFSWYFLDTDTEPNGVQSHVSLQDADGGTVVSIVSKGGDFFWQTMESTRSDDAYVRSVADFCLDDRAETGPLVDLLRAGRPIVFHTHWQSLYSNGRRTGLRALEIVFERINKHWGDKVEWLKCSELAARVATET